MAVCAFGHNEGEILQAKRMAEELNMRFYFEAQSGPPLLTGEGY